MGSDANGYGGNIMFYGNDSLMLSHFLKALSVLKLEEMKGHCAICVVGAFHLLLSIVNQSYIYRSINMYYTIGKFISEGRSIPIKARNTFRKDYLDFPDQEN